MKKFDRMKTVELVFLIVLAILCFYKIVLGSDIYQQITTNKDLLVLCVFLWVTLFFSFICIFVDFSLYSSQNRTLNYLDSAANTDNVARIANRFSIDSIIDEYADKDIPGEMGCVMIELTSLKDVNSNFGRAEGNRLIRNFSIILKLSSLDECIVGRNGGNRFIVLYEKNADLNLEVFLDRLEEKVSDHNADTRNHLIKYAFGTAYAEKDDITVITQLIALSSRRLNEKQAAEEEAKLRAELEAANLMPDVVVPTQTKEERAMNEEAEIRAILASQADKESAEIVTDEELDSIIPRVTPITQAEIERIASQKHLFIDMKRTRVKLNQSRRTMR